jgi:hypothetical protein
MARRRIVAIACALFSLLQGPPANGQSLGDAARAERQRRSAGPEKVKAKKVYTNDDFPAVLPKQPTRELPAVRSEQQNRAEQREAEVERIWRRRFAEARARLREAEQRAWQSRIQTVFVGGGGLLGLTTGAAVPVQMQVREFVETEELRQARKALADLEDDLRRAGLPPGWGRE